ncbi:hypothetical protein CACET_c28000 [Clostridium aceticum]|uniref:Uncharacterized protein n=1 Tax=Clostridium aceticum TaxID=84022 RepID=A0A0D8I9D3_9CLOT|nr:hypothetical protein [Clostridium aceticum]AKL96245.1 hypothetical protein CACET_c28000 [Clostridium aceticum]KJF26652.1 hypothetical protein TZ02_12350 [Clostridium aceticum]
MGKIFDVLKAHQISLGEFEDMGKIFDVLKTHQISLGEFKGKVDEEQGTVNKTVPKVNGVRIETKVKLDETKELYEVLGIDSRMLENLGKKEKTIYAIGIYIMQSLGKFVFDSTDAYRRMSNNRLDIQGSEYEVLNKIENGITSDDVLAFRYISIVLQMVCRKDENIKIDYTPLGLVATISDPESKGIPILLRFTCKEDGNQTLEKANKLQVSKAGGSDFNK